jgi:hypothetical protein
MLAAKSRLAIESFSGVSFSCSLENTSSKRLVCHSSASESFAIKSPSVVNKPVSSFFDLITRSFLPLTLDAALLPLVVAKNGTSRPMVPLSALATLSALGDAKASFSSRASILAFETAKTAFARSSCLAMSSSSVSDFGFAARDPIKGDADDGHDFNRWVVMTGDNTNDEAGSTPDKHRRCNNAVPITRLKPNRGGEKEEE